MEQYIPSTRPLLSSENEDDHMIMSSSGDKDVRSRHQIYRRGKRCKRFLLISAGVLIILLLIYIPLFNTMQSRLVPISGWSSNTSRNTVDYVLPNSDTTIIEPRGACLTNFFLLVIVCSSVDNFVARQEIRETWGNTTEFNYPLFAKIHSHLAGQYLDINELSVRRYAEYLNIKNTNNLTTETNHQLNIPVRVVFLIGKPDKDKNFGNESLARLKLESEQYDDIIQEDFIDTYNNLTIKSIMMLKWVMKKCLIRAKFLMKCDDDTFINIPNLLHVLLGGTVPVLNVTLEFYDQKTVKVLSPENRMTASQNLLMGYKFCKVKPVADVSSKWYAPAYMFSGDTYPNYLSGSSYVMSFDVIPKLYNASLNTTLLHLEDVYLTGIVAEKIHLNRRHNSLFSFGRTSKKCVYKGVVSQHYLKGDLMRVAYNYVMNMSNYCIPPAKYYKKKRLHNRSKICY